MRILAIDLGKSKRGAGDSGLAGRWGRGARHGRGIRALRMASKALLTERTMSAR